MLEESVFCVPLLTCLLGWTLSLFVIVLAAVLGLCTAVCFITATTTKAGACRGRIGGPLLILLILTLSSQFPQLTSSCWRLSINLCPSSLIPIICPSPSTSQSPRAAFLSRCRRDVGQISGKEGCWKQRRVSALREKHADARLQYLQVVQRPWVSGQQAAAAVRNSQVTAGVWRFQATACREGPGAHAVKADVV